MRWPTGFDLCPNSLHPLNEQTSLPRKGPVAFTARLCSERGTEARGVFSVVSCEGSSWTRSQGLGEPYVDIPYRFTSDEVFKLDQGTSTAFATVRGWRNSFISINRIPSDILSLIPTHLSSQKDRLRASFVCRRWRRIFLQHGALWSQLYLSKGEVYVKTLLERAKGSPLDVFASYVDPVSTITLLVPHAKQIRHLDFVYDYWEDIQTFSRVNSGSFPLLRTLVINAAKEIDLEDPEVMTPSSLPLFSNTHNLTEFRLHSERPPFLSHFVFPNLTAFELSVVLSAELDERFQPSQLFDFLEASPMLRTVRMRIVARMSLECVPEERLVVLPNLETLHLVASDWELCYEIPTRISCPSAKHTSLMHEKVVDEDDTIMLETFPDPVSWKAIVRQYTKSPVEEVTLEIKGAPDPIITCSLTFQSPDAVAIRLGYKLTANDEDEDLAGLPSATMYPELFSRASETIQALPLLVDVKRLHIYNSPRVLDSDDIAHIADEVRQLFQSVGPLEELTMCCCDLRSYLIPPKKSRGIGKPVVFPPVRELTISHPSYPPREECMAAIVRLAKSQHARGVPFERVTLRMEGPPAKMVERLSPSAILQIC